MELFEHKIHSQTIYSGRILNLKNDTVSLPDGRTAHREVVEHGGGVCVLAVTEKGIPFVKQYRYPVGECVLELPAGKLEKGEEPAACGMRELEEETGLTAASLRFVAKIYPSPGYTSELLYVYFADGCTAGTANLDEGEFLSVEYFPQEKVKKMLQNGEILDAKTYIALSAYFMDFIKE